MGNCVACEEQILNENQYTTEVNPQKNDPANYVNSNISRNSQNDTEKSFNSLASENNHEGNSKENKIQISGEKKEEKIEKNHIPTNYLLLTELPDFSNELTKAAAEKFGQFNYKNINEELYP